MIRFDASQLAEVVASTAQDIRESMDEQALRQIGFAGADVFRDEVKRNALSNYRTGMLYNNIIIKRLEEDSDGDTRQVYVVTVREGRRGGEWKAYYWRWVEAGHKIVPRNTNISARTGRKIGWAAHRRAAELEYGSRKVPAHPFVRPAYESKKATATNAMTKALADILARNARDR